MTQQAQLKNPLIPQVGTPYTAEVTKILKSERTFVGAGVLKRKYEVYFENGYQVEYCPPAEQPIGFKEGDSITFRIAHRNNRGDEIEVLQVHPLTPEPQPPATPAQPATPATSMIGHPAVIALATAKDYAIAAGMTLDEMLEKADRILAWLKLRRDIDSIDF